MREKNTPQMLDPQADLIDGMDIDELLPKATPRPLAIAGQDRRPKPSRAVRAVELALRSGATFWHNPDGEPYADIPLDGARATLPVYSRGFRRWLAGLLFSEAGVALGGDAANAAVDIVAAYALFSGETREVFVRVAPGPEGHIFIDLGDDSWRAIEITPAGWRTVPCPPVRFLRSRGMRPLPEPVPGDGWARLRKILAHVSDRDFLLMVAWLIGAIRPTGPYAILWLCGEPGSAKTSTGRILRSFVDPAAAPLRSPPRDERDLVATAKNSWAVGWTICRICPIGYRTRSAALPPAAAIRRANCIRTPSPWFLNSPGPRSLHQSRSWPSAGISAIAQWR
ncbi:MAG: hypothetical protein KatS3mg081_0551 [Gemmatimonadales bacterium]|nr:MAG: hypothetical protein KatS3mg081_0551 [Gemmatimonadales bacterium]